MINYLKRQLKLDNAGSTKKAFLRDTIAPLIKEDTQVYKYFPDGKFVERDYYKSSLETPNALRNGNLFAGAVYKGRTYFAGINSEKYVRAPIQNNFHDSMSEIGFKHDSPHFRVMEYKSRFYSRFGTYNPYSIYGQ